MNDKILEEAEELIKSFGYKSVDDAYNKLCKGEDKK